MKILVAVGASEAWDTFFTPKVQAQLEAMGDVHYNTTGRQAFTKEELIEHIVDVDVLLTGWGSPRVDADVLAHANALKVHAHCAGSVASYVSAEEYERGIIVLSGNDLFAKSVAEGCLSYTLNALRRHSEVLNEVQQGGWRLPQRSNKGLIGKKIGIVGFGAISRYFLELLQWFHPEILLYSEHTSAETAAQYNARKASLEEIFSTCEIISLHSAWTPKTENMIDAHLLSLIPDGALLVNAARAHLIEKDAFYSALAENRFYAALDVFYEEPLPATDPLRSMPNVTIYPHAAGPTFDMRELVSLRLIEDIQNIFAGKPYQDAIPYTHAKRMSTT